MGYMKMIFKKGLFCLAASVVFAVLWLLMLNITDFMNYELITLIVFIAVSICITLVSMRKYLAQKDVNIIKRIGSIVLITVLSVAVMVGVFYLAIFILLSSH